MSKNTKPTDEQIQQQIDWLKKNKPEIPKFTSFGDNNHEAIDAGLRVLEERMSLDKVYTTFPIEGDEGFAEEDYVKEHVRDEAVFAAQWLEGESEVHSPEDSWKNSVGVKPRVISVPPSRK